MPLARQLAKSTHRWVQKAENVVHRGFLALLIASYVLAACAPSLGQWLRSQRWQADEGFQVTISLSRVLLTFLLFLAGLSIDVTKLWDSICRPIPLGCSLLAKLLVPTSVVLLMGVLIASFGSGPYLAEMLLGLWSNSTSAKPEARKRSS